MKILESVKTTRLQIYLEAHEAQNLLFPVIEEIKKFQGAITEEKSFKNGKYLIQADFPSESLRMTAQNNLSNYSGK